MKFLTILIICVNILLSNSWSSWSFYDDFDGYTVYTTGTPKCRFGNTTEKVVKENVTAEINAPKILIKGDTRTASCGEQITVSIKGVQEYYIKTTNEILVRYTYKTSGIYFTRTMPRDCKTETWDKQNKKYYCTFKEINPNGTLQ
uniref:Uncharacterized protein n=1 Tax=Strongyloides papillosus TaxID=174720 RepID=A0A0N5CAV5_STREA